MSLRVDADFPGGNTIVEKIEGNDIYLRHDLRDTDGFWFWWCCRVSGAKKGDALRFHFHTERRVIDTRGPAVSLDKGNSWSYPFDIGMIPEDGLSFSYDVPADAEEIRFATAIPYLQSDWRKFVHSLREMKGWNETVLTKSNGGRDVEMLRAGADGARKEYVLFLTARHHCCECIANFVMEGMIETYLSDTPTGEFLRSKMELAAIPFMDKDGVEKGDQGKNRKPHDHNRDYAEDGGGIYSEVRAYKQLVKELVAGRKGLSFDIHCPYLNGNGQNNLFIVGSRNPVIAKEQVIFGEILEKVNQGPLPFKASGYFPFGVGWNSGTIVAACASWMSTVPEMRLASSFEIPYATVLGYEVSGERMRSFGHAVAASLAEYLR